ncbi:RES family NAD+ phosphorylase [Vibrio cholerae]|uniref:RES family NAD+ phosphorylase n=3 Tax=Vibrio cholerae TaxID=666 RepID=UPI0011D5B11D|nr:RES family NAD+ phosphorylase [Vibrio cholerae]TXY24713.1 RES family NAD+ phosphorylase [Vibrio cholerae]GHX77470.1 RES domain-containing protein [Vibrio cholerae]HDI3156232.1 RES family NAD+ phosphorylase [Vibrio cholerae]HDI3160079.1 RES family NAD+ phosphorylase [Vibrio cholerae]
MSYQCCSNCFTDTSVKQYIGRKSTTGDCSFCHAEDVLVIDPKDLSDQFELILCCVEESNNGYHLSKIYTDDLKTISDSVINKEALIDSILDNISIGKKYELIESLNGFQSEWQDLKHDLINKNRFFPNTALYGRIFANRMQEQDITNESSAFLRTISHLERDIRTGKKYYRARISNNELSASDMGAPLVGMASAGRANPAGIPYLYLAESEEICCHEVRPSNGAKIFISEAEIISNLKLIDLSNPKQKLPLLQFEEEELELVIKSLHLLEQFSNELSVPVLPENSHLEYIPTQFVCEYLRNIGPYHGLIFNSSYGVGKNIVLFSDDKVLIHEPKSKRVQSVMVKFG